MPIYEYQCNTCSSEFQMVLTISEHRKGGIFCPCCRDANVTRMFVDFCTPGARARMVAIARAAFVTHPHEDPPSEPFAFPSAA